MKSLLIVILLLLANSSFGQRETREIIDAKNLTGIQINTDEVFLLSLNVIETSQIKIKTHSEGEYFDNIILETEIKGKNLIITTNYPERLAGGFDKLSAHKVFSLEIELEVPKGLEISIKSNIASLQAKGAFKSMYADLKQGYCKLNNFSGSAVINTYSGNIFVETSAGLIEANSRNGTVVIPKILPGRNPLRLTSIDGDIMVRKN
ncbi:hypothetical protein [Christiangramia sp.]|uniref:hypothetical protein n=1 Tax=Christiangramia sp. TaxID=1931228 RepID=UPI0026279155|nr:hypothetical protein [Christiangramia sp.]